MKRKSYIIGIVWLFFAWTGKAEECRVQESLCFYSRILRQEVCYSVVLPEEYHQDNRRYPVLYFLHGIGDSEWSWLEYGWVPQHLDALTREGKIAPMIAVMPQGYRSYYTNRADGSFSWQDMFVQELVPRIDSLYRTLPQPEKRGVIGYSMGGFGALVLPLLHPELFRVSIPLSASIRTDGQYMEEEQQGWDEQWGKIFGGIGKQGKERLTSYYREHSPFHLLKTMPVEQIRQTAFFIDNGDREQTLCRSNEELHMLLNERGIPHEYRVRSGAHDFVCWRGALPDALCFADRCFGEEKLPATTSGKREFPPVLLKETEEYRCRVYLPEDPQSCHRLYSTIYFLGKLSVGEQKRLVEQYRQGYQECRYPPLIFCFPEVQSVEQLVEQVIPWAEEQVGARQGRRFRAVWGYGEAGNLALQAALLPGQFTGFALTAASLPLQVENRVEAAKENRHSLHGYIDTPSGGKGYPGNGWLHIALRERGFVHEYRVRTGQADLEFLREGFAPALNYLSARFHD